MRIGTNPEKLNVKELAHKPHRVIIPVYIPNLEEDYFKNALDVLKICLDSLIVTTNPEQTNITVINNASCKEVSDTLEKYFNENKIDRLVKLSENRGKVEAVLSEAKASFEEYITISDADVFFKEGWLEASLKIFDAFKPGVVMPMPTPNNYSMHNTHCFVRHFWSRTLKYDSAVDKMILIDFEKSVGSQGLMKKYYERQFYLEANNVRATLGAGHFVATYDRSLFDFIPQKKVNYVFQNGQERDYLDILTTETATCRLGTSKAYVVHLGNQASMFSGTTKTRPDKKLYFPELPRRRRSPEIMKIFYKFSYAMTKRFYR